MDNDLRVEVYYWNEYIGLICTDRLRNRNVSNGTVADSTSILVDTTYIYIVLLVGLGRSLGRVEGVQKEVSIKGS